MRRIACMIIACLLAASLAGCGRADENMVKTPADMRMQRGRNYREVIEDFEDKGFTNINTEAIEDLEYGHTFRNGHVETISVGGDTDYDAGVLVPSDIKVIIRYHTYNPSSIGRDENNTDSQENSVEPAGTQNGENAPVNDASAGTGQEDGEASDEEMQAGEGREDGEASVDEARDSEGREDGEASDDESRDSESREDGEASGEDTQDSADRAGTDSGE